MRNPRNQHRLLIVTAASTFVLWVAMFSFVIGQRNAASTITDTSIVSSPAIERSSTNTEVGERSKICKDTASMKIPQNNKVLVLLTGSFEFLYPQLVTFGVLVGTAAGALMSWHKRRGSVWVAGGAVAAIILFAGMIVGQKLATGSHLHSRLTAPPYALLDCCGSGFCLSIPTI